MSNDVGDSRISEADDDCFASESSNSETEECNENRKQI